ncbi:MAG: hypothetical protein ACC661_09435, partial [Verrucomicrobiales bacterium]
MELKPLSKKAIPSALEKAKHYRLLNEPSAAESIIRDVLRVDPENQEALIVLVLSMADQFGRDYVVAKQHVDEVLSKLEGDYQREYYSGIVCERRGVAQLRGGAPGSAHNAYEWFHEAMGHYQAAEKASPSDNDDAILRWNTCLRLIERNRLEARES